jgi:sRNA-binding regulator protein Hfq
MSINDPLVPPKEFLRELARDERSQDARRRDSHQAPVPPPRFPASSSGAPAHTATLPPKSVQALLNTPVVLHLRGGTQLQGVLVSVLTYEFVIKTGDNTYLIVMKHGVDMLEPAGTA